MVQERQNAGKAKYFLNEFEAKPLYIFFDMAFANFF